MTTSNNNNIPGINFPSVNNQYITGTCSPGPDALNNTYNYGSVYMWPIWLDGSLEIDGWAIQVSTAVASSTCEMGLYDTVSATDPTPNSLIVDSGSIDTSTTGLKSGSFAGITPANGLYWIAFLLSSNTATPSINAAPANTATSDLNIGCLIGGKTAMSGTDASNCIYNTDYAGSPITGLPSTWSAAISRGTEKCPAFLQINF